jgi:hypothetical protein
LFESRCPEKDPGHIDQEKSKQCINK